MCFRNVRVIDKPNGGTGSALNVGHEAARGKYVTWWSADNIYYPQFCEVFASVLMQAEMAQHNCELMYSDFSYIDEKGTKIQDVVHQKPQGPAYLIEGYDVGMSFMYTKNLWLKAGPYWNRICEDYHWTVRAAKFTNFGLVRGILASFRVHGGQITGHRQAEEKSAADECRRLAKEFFGPKQEDEVLMPFAQVPASC
jgi:glycosyltransferase involved in cell wall biosynthesis